MQKHLAFGIICCTCLSMVAGAADWPQWRGPARNGSSPETGWNTDWQKTPPTLLWEVTIGDGVSHPSIVDGKVYVVGLLEGGRDELRCLDLENGETIWEASVASIVGGSESRGNMINGPVATPSIDGDQLFSYHRTHELRCWSISKRKLLWEVNVLDRHGVCSSKRSRYWTPGNSPLVLDDKVIVSGYGTAGAIALRRTSGELIWKAYGADDTDYDGPRPQKGGSNVWTSPSASVVNGRMCVLLHLNRDVVCLDAATGEELWRHQEERWPGPACVADVLSVGEFLVAAGYTRQEGIGRVLDQKGELVRRLPSLVTAVGSPAVDSGWLYVSRVAVEAATGDEVRTNVGEPIVVGGKVLGLTSSRLTLGELKNGAFKVLGSVPVQGDRWAAPVFSDGRILFRSSRTSLACWDLRREKQVALR